MITIVILSFIAGVLTVAAPCILPLLPVVLGGSLAGGEDDKQKWLRPVIITASLAASVIIFTLLLKATTALLGVPQAVWQLVAGTLVTFLGVNFLWPKLWEKLSIKANLSGRTNTAFSKAFKAEGTSGMILTGAALGPVFSSCSPTYAFIVAAILPVSFLQGLIYLIAYAVGMSAVLLLLALIGQSLVTKLKWLSDPGGWFRRLVGVMFIIVGVTVIFGLDKKFQAFVLEKGWYDPISNLEEKLKN